MKKEIITSKNVPVAIDLKTGKIIDIDIKARTRIRLENLETVLEPYSVSMKNIVKITIFLKDMDNFARVNKIYGKYFTDKIPAKSYIEVSRLPKDAEIEIEAIAIYEEIKWHETKEDGSRYK